MKLLNPEKYINRIVVVLLDVLSGLVDSSKYSSLV